MTDAHHSAQLIFVFLVETGFYHVDEADLKLLSPSDPPTLATQSAEITGVNHYAQAFPNFLNSGFLKIRNLCYKHRGLLFSP